MNMFYSGRGLTFTHMQCYKLLNAFNVFQNDENYVSALESFRKQWKQELQAGTKRITDFDGRAGNKNNRLNPGLRTSDHPSCPPVLSACSHISSKKQVHSYLLIQSNVNQDKWMPPPLTCLMS